MKDYRLSEIRDICRKNKDCVANGSDCECAEYCGTPHMLRTAPMYWNIDIEPRDMIELPCKIPLMAINEQVLSWQVAYRSVLGTGDIRTRLFDTEAEADAFLAELKGDKV